MQLLKLKETINFMKLRLPAMVLSTLLILGSLVSLGVNSLNWGLDFTGGTLIEVGYEDAADLEAIRLQLAENNFPDAVVQNFGSSTDVLIRIAPRDPDCAVLPHRTRGVSSLRWRGRTCCNQPRSSAGSPTPAARSVAVRAAEEGRRAWPSFLSPNRLFA